MIPIFKSEFSQKSILTLEPFEPEPEKRASMLAAGGPDSIIDICIDNNIKKFWLVDDNLSSFPQAVSSSNKAGLDMIFGWRVEVVEQENIAKETIAERYANSHKIIIFLKSIEGYPALCRLHKEALVDNGGLTEAILKKHWNDEFKLVIPFYDSFIYTNQTTFQNCMFDYEFFKPGFFLEDNDLPVDGMIRSFIQKNYSEHPLIEAKSIYYKTRKDVKPYMVYRCIHNRGSKLEKPKLDHFGSEEFCFESYLEKING